MRDGYAVLVRGPENGAIVYVGAKPPRKIDFQETDRIARYVRCTRLQFDAFRSRGCGHTGQVTYRFKGYIQETNLCSP
jgi:hypothetical protein